MARSAREVVRRRIARGTERADARSVRVNARWRRRRLARWLRRHVPEGHRSRAGDGLRGCARGARVEARTRSGDDAIRGAGRDPPIGRRCGRRRGGGPVRRGGRRPDHRDAPGGLRLHRLARTDALGAAARSSGQRLRAAGAPGGARRDRRVDQRRLEQRRAGERRDQGRSRRVALARPPGSAFALERLLSGVGPPPGAPREPVCRRLRVAARPPRRGAGTRDGLACSTSPPRSRACSGTCGSPSLPGPSTRPTCFRKQVWHARSCSPLGKRPP